MAGARDNGKLAAEVDERTRAGYLHATHHIITDYCANFNIIIYIYYELLGWTCVLCLHCAWSLCIAVIYVFTLTGVPLNISIRRLQIEMGFTVCERLKKSHFKKINIEISKYPDVVK